MLAQRNHSCKFREQDSSGFDRNEWVDKITVQFTLLKPRVIWCPSRNDQIFESSKPIVIFIYIFETAHCSITLRSPDGRTWLRNIANCVAPSLFHLSNSKHYRDWLRQTRHNWQTSIPSYDLSTQSTGSTLSSDVETLSMTLDSSQAIPHSQDNRQVWTSSDSTLPINSQEPLSSNPMEATGPPTSAQMTTPLSAIVNYVNNSGGGVHKRREVERLTFSLSSSDVSDTTRPARRRRIIHDSPSPLIYRHTPTNPTQNDSGHA